MSTALARSDVARARDQYRRDRARRSTGAALFSALLALVILAVLITSSPGWPRVRASFLSLSAARESVLPILTGLWLNVRILVVAEVLVLAFGLLLALARTVRGPVALPLRAASAAYTDVFRGLPLIILLYLVGFGLPALRLQGIPNSPEVLGTLAIVLTYSAYVGEVFRAGIDGVPPSQRLAARSLGLTYRQTLRMVILPQAVRRVLPPLLNDFVALQKDVGLVSVLGAVDAVRQAQIAQQLSYNFTPYVIAGLAFIVLAVPSARIADAVARRAQRREQAGGAL